MKFPYGISDFEYPHEWVMSEKAPNVILNPIKKLKENLQKYSKAYDLPGCHRTSNMVDRLMQKMDRHLFASFCFHGSLEAAELSIRGWALMHNVAPCNPTTVKRHDGWKSPAEWLNKRRYHESWLQNLLTSASMGGFKHMPQIRYNQHRSGLVKSAFKQI